MHRYTNVNHYKTRMSGTMEWMSREKEVWNESSKQCTNSIISFTDIFISLTVMFIIDLRGSIFVSSKYGSAFSQMCDFFFLFAFDRMLEVLFYSSYHCV